MRIKKLTATLTVATLLMSSVVCSAATYSTTTTYDASGSLLSLKTEVSGLEAGSMVTYALYGKDGSVDAATGAITPTTATGITEDNLIYIDQIDSANATETFTVNGISASDIAGSKIIVGAEDGSNPTDSSTDSNGYVGNDDMTAAVSVASTVDWTKIASISVKIAGGSTYTLTSANTTCYVPVGSDVTFEITPVAGNAVGTVKLNDSELASPYKYTVSNTTALSIEATTTVSKHYVTVDTTAEIDADAKSVTFFIADADSASIGVNVYIYEGKTEVGSIKGLENKGTLEGRYAIKVVDVDGLAGFYDAGYTYKCVPVYKSGDNYVELTKESDGYYYK